jgi:hypothetical protein
MWGDPASGNAGGEKNPFASPAKAGAQLGEAQ